MSEAFLHELLQSSNIEKIKGERCSICLEEFETLSRETGTIEVATRLPCKHLVGSACISTWLKDNNSCPICRREFFPAQPPPLLEHDIMEGPGDEPRSDREINEDYCLQLDLNIEIAMISGYLTRKLIELRLLAGHHTQYCIIAVSIYMASHLVSNMRSPREIATVAGTNADIDASHIRETYNEIYSQRERLADVQLHYLMEEVFDETGPLKWPAPGNEVTDREIENRQIMVTLRNTCANACGAIALGEACTELTARIATTLYPAENGILTALLSPREMAGASIVMASRITHDSCTILVIADALNMTTSALRTVYSVAFAHRDILVGEPWLANYGIGSTRTLLRELPLPGEL